MLYISPVCLANGALFLVLFSLTLMLKRKQRKQRCGKNHNAV
jgi:hypothetical protein